MIIPEPLTFESKLILRDDPPAALIPYIGQEFHITSVTKKFSPNYEELYNIETYAFARIPLFANDNVRIARPDTISFSFPEDIIRKHFDIEG